MLNLRPAVDTDEPFVNALTRETMRTYVESTWSDQRDRERYYAGNSFHREHTRIICDGERAVGRVTLAYRDGGLFIDNLHIIPEMQNRGIGAWVLETVIAEGESQGLPIRLTVLRNNPARRLYDRAGFAVIGEADQRYAMEYRRRSLRFEAIAASGVPSRS